MADDDVTPIEHARNKNQVAETGATLEAKKKFWSEALMQLTESKRFLEFVDANYTIGIHKDDETKTVEVQVIEKPTVAGPPLTADQTFKLHVACARAGAKDPLVLLRQILRILGQEPPSAIISPSGEAELKQAIAAADAQDKLKQGLDG